MLPFLVNRLRQREKNSTGLVLFRPGFDPGLRSVRFGDRLFFLGFGLTIFFSRTLVLHFDFLFVAVAAPFDGDLVFIGVLFLFTSGRHDE
jgi:hypothetical protein